MDFKKYESPELNVLSQWDSDVITTSDVSAGTETTVTEEKSGGSWVIIP